MSESPHQTLADELAGVSTVMLLGAMDTGKTTMAQAIAAHAVTRGRMAAIVDADVDNSSVGPPTCAGLRFVRDESDLATVAAADHLHFVGTTNPSRLVLQMVIATASLVDQARQEGADVVIIDTTGAISGVVGETLKYHKMELSRPERVVALQRGGEMEPMVGMLKRFFSAHIDVLAAHPDTKPSSPDERAQRRVGGLRQAFAGPLETWRVRPTVFAPTLPTGLDLERLSEVLVSVQDSNGRCLGLGRLEYEEGALRVRTNAGEGMTGLRLGSVRIDLDTFETKPVSLREIMFGI